MLVLKILQSLLKKKKAEGKKQFVPSPGGFREDSVAWGSWEIAAP